MNHFLDDGKGFRSVEEEKQGTKWTKRKASISGRGPRGGEA